MHKTYFKADVPQYSETSYTFKIHVKFFFTII